MLRGLRSIRVGAVAAAVTAQISIKMIKRRLFANKWWVYDTHIGVCSGGRGSLSAVLFKADLCTKTCDISRDRLTYIPLSCVILFFTILIIPHSYIICALFDVQYRKTGWLGTAGWMETELWQVLIWYSFGSFKFSHSLFTQFSVWTLIMFENVSKLIRRFAWITGLW